MNDSASITNDEVLLSLLREGDESAFDAIFRKYYKPLCAYAFRYVVMEDAKGIVQDLFVWLWDNRSTLMIHSSFSSYLFRAVYTRCLTRIQHNAVKQRAETCFWENHSQCSYIQEYQLEELKRRIFETLEKMPASYRDAFIQHRFYDKSYKEIAMEMNVSNKTIDYRIQQALKFLRQELKDYFPLFVGMALQDRWTIFL